MDTNNAEVMNQADVETTEGTTETNAIDAGDTATGEQSSGVEENEQSQVENDLVYDLDGEEVSVNTIREWKKGHMLQSDYTKKRQADAEYRKQLEAQHKEVESVKTKLTDIVSQLEAEIKRDMNPEQLADLRDSDPSEYLRVKEEIAAREKLAEQARNELKAINEQNEAKRIAEETEKFLAIVTEWQDPVKREAEIKLMNDYTTSNEFSEDDIGALKSHKLMKMTLDAAKYHKLKKEVEKTGKQVESAHNFSASHRGSSIQAVCRCMPR